MESFEAAKSWVAELQNTDTLLALAGNKCDLDSNRKVETSVAQQYADDMNILFWETSAKSGHNVTELFQELAEKLPRASKEGETKDKNGFKVGKAADAPAGGPCGSC